MYNVNCTVCTLYSHPCAHTCCCSSSSMFCLTKLSVTSDMRWSGKQYNWIFGNKSRRIFERYEVHQRMDIKMENINQAGKFANLEVCLGWQKRLSDLFHRTKVTLGSGLISTTKDTFLKLCWCDSGWGQYRLLGFCGGDGCHWDGGCQDDT